MVGSIEDTIAAVSSPPGVAVRGIVRCSGPHSIDMGSRLFDAAPPVDLNSSPGFRRFRGEIEIDENAHVPGELYLFKAPRSYTRQDGVEFHLPGSPPVLAMLLDRLIRFGARLAEPGEFTARAFLNGAMDVSRAEAVAALIRSRSDSQLRAARRMMVGQLEARVRVFMDGLCELVALVEADIDFAEEPIEFITPTDLSSRLNQIDMNLADLLQHAESVERIETLPRIFLGGRSNVGKSTLMNRLADMDRSICSPQAGTTRDLLTATIRVGRGQALLLDAAGVDDDAQGLVKAAADVGRSAAADADVLCWVVDVTDPRTFQNRVFAGPSGRGNELIICNKTDLLDEPAVTRHVDSLKSTFGLPVCAVSAKTGHGLDNCRRLMDGVLHLSDASAAGDGMVISVRQRAALESARDAIQRCRQEAASTDQTSDRGEILAFELSEAMSSLQSVTGSVTTEDVLGRIFANFCIGK